MNANLQPESADSEVAKVLEHLDPIRFSVIRNRFETIGEEMTLAVERTAWSSVLSIARDYSCMIYDAHPDGARLVTMAECLPIHCNSVSTVLDNIEKSFDGDINDGDVFLVNDPFSGNTHVCDLITCCPVFIDGQNTFWSIARGHQIDQGAAEASSIVPAATSIFQEGLIIPPVKLVDRGVERHDVLALYLANIRYKREQEGDMRAQLGSIGVGRKQLIQLCEKYGRDEVLRYVDGLMAYADKRASEAFKQIPDGVYEGSTWTDNDGRGGTRIPIKVTVTVSGDNIHVDYSGSGPQSPGAQNGTFGVMTAAATIPFLCYIDSDIPKNQGVLNHISATAEEGTVCLAKYPAATSGATQNPADPMIEVINIAMANAITDLVPAGSSHTSHVPNFHGFYEESGEEWGCMLFNCAGGQGASKNTDGWPLFTCLAGMGGLTCGSVELLEMGFPLLVEQMEVETDAMGFGRWNGGPGVRSKISPVNGDMETMGVGEGINNPPHGVAGGKRSTGGGIWVQHADGSRTYTSSAHQLLISVGESWNGVSLGGGGWGNPIDRPPEQVRRDILNEFVSEKTAREVFGVVLNDDLERTLDLSATELLRKELAAVERPFIDQANESEASEWTRSRMTERDRYLEQPTLQSQLAKK